jgi:hypothetical protein
LGGGKIEAEPGIVTIQTIGTNGTTLRPLSIIAMFAHDRRPIQRELGAINAQLKQGPTVAVKVELEEKKKSLLQRTLRVALLGLNGGTLVGRALSLSYDASQCELCE